FSNYETFKYNQLITNELGNESFELCTTRLEFSNNSLKEINFLFKIDVVESGEEYYNFFSAVTVDIPRNLVIIRFDQHLMDCHEHDSLDLINEIKGILNGANVRYESFDLLELNVIGMHSELPKKIISSLFKE